MNDSIHAYDGIANEEITETRTVSYKNGTITHEYTLEYNEDMIVDMPFIGSGDKADLAFLQELLKESPEYISKYNIIDINNGNVSAVSNNPQCWYRDAMYYFHKLLDKHPGAFSNDTANGNVNNRWRIEYGFNPIVDRQFVDYFGKYEECMGEMLDHHHIGRDGQCIALPESIHRGVNGIHDAE